MVECELCGRPIVGRSYRITVEGAELTVCNSCYLRMLSRKVGGQAKTTYPLKTIPQTRKQTTVSPKPKIPRRTPAFDIEYEIVEDYALKIKKARERLGWSLNILAQKVREKESVLRRIEQGKLTPPMDLAKKLEKILGIKLLEPTVEEYSLKRIGNKDLTLGDIVVIRKKKGEK